MFTRQKINDKIDRPEKKQKIFRRNYLAGLISCFISALIFITISASADKDIAVEVPAADKTFILWQLPSRTGSQIMSYVIKSINGKIIVIDGGMSGDAAYLSNFIAKLGGKVECWIITHPHLDHMDALKTILNKHGNIKIKTIYASFNDASWMEKYTHKDEIQSYRDFMDAMKNKGKKINELKIGQVIAVDGVSIEILSVKNPEIIRNPINNSSVAFVVKDKVKSVLFLSDLGVEGGKKLLHSPMASRLKNCQYVQMAHHGQNGVDKDFYVFCKPVFCLWPTPKWLWDNNPGAGYNTGKWKTLETRKWMKDLGAKRNYCLFDGLVKIE
jgi:hypothetical protein